VAHAAEQSAIAAWGYGRPEYLELWKNLPPDSTVEEVTRNFFIRQPVLWVKLSDAALKAIPKSAK